MRKLNIKEINIRSYTEKLSFRYRACLYSLPLFLQWIVALTWEKDERALCVAKRAMALSVIYLLVIGFLFFGQGIMVTLFSQNVYIIQLVVFFTHIIANVVYVGVSFWMTVLSYQEKWEGFRFLDSTAALFERIITI